jgi:hypothetical protein
MAGVVATTNLYARLNPWLVGIVGSSEVGETTKVGGTLTDISADTRGFNNLEISYGIQGTGPLDRIAQTGTCTFALNNMVNNSHSQQGAYSPGHTNAVAGWDIGVEILVTVTYDSVTYYKFSGKLVDVQPDAGKRRQGVVCTAVDWFDEAARAKVKNVTIQTNKRADELITTLVEDAVKNQPNATSFATGQSTFVKAFDNLADAQTSVLSALNDCVVSELGYLYIKGDTTQGGTLTFEDRHARPKKGAASATFDNTMGRLNVMRGRENIINRVYVVVHPRTTDASESVLYELTTTGEQPAIPAGNTITINCPYKESSISAYRVAAESLVTPVSGTDWIANTVADGSGSNITSSVVITVSNQAANSAELTVVNNHASSTAYLTTLQIRGIAVRDVSETVLSAVDVNSAFSFGEIDSRVDMKYESNAGEFGNEIAKWILNVYKDPRYVVSEFSLISNKSAYLMLHSLAREPGDKITFSEDLTGIEATGASGAEIGYFINGIRLSIDVPSSMINTSWTLAPATSSATWILNQIGASEIGITTNLGFA